MTCRGTRSATTCMGSLCWVIRSIGRTPEATISNLELVNEGNTNPGQSHKVSLLDIIRVWKCFVLPGVEVTPVRFSPTNALIVELLPTLGYPTNPTVTLLDVLSDPNFLFIKAISSASDCKRASSSSRPHILVSTSATSSFGSSWKVLVLPSKAAVAALADQNKKRIPWLRKYSAHLALQIIEDRDVSSKPYRKEVCVVRKFDNGGF